jgi:type I restriction enzyme S subunit
MLKASNGHESRINSESLVLSKARTLKSGLMDDLLTGHVRVTPLLQGTATA